MAKIGIFGGTFDPVHLGHLLIAEQSREHAHLDQVWFIPAPRPPHKQDRDLTPFSQRVEMLSLAIAGQPAFRIDELEKDRSGPSYTADTLAELHRRQPEAELWLLIGSDCLPDLPHWHDPARILSLAGLLIWERPRFPVWNPVQLGTALGWPEGPMRYQVVPGPLVDISSSALRQRAAEGRSLRYLVPRAVECYIENHHLYQRG